MTTLPHCGEIPPGVYQAMAITLRNYLGQGGLVWVRLGASEWRLVDSKDITLDGGKLTIDLLVPKRKARR